MDLFCQWWLTNKWPSCPWPTNFVIFSPTVILRRASDGAAWGGIWQPAKVNSSQGTQESLNTSSKSFTNSPCLLNKILLSQFSGLKHYSNGHTQPYKTACSNCWENYLIVFVVNVEFPHLSDSVHHYCQTANLHNHSSSSPCGRNSNTINRGSYRGKYSNKQKANYRIV